MISPSFKPAFSAALPSVTAVITAPSDFLSLLLSVLVVTPKNAFGFPGLLSELSSSERKDVIAFIEKNHEKLRELSLRMAIKLGALRKNSSNWERLALVTCCK